MKSTIENMRETTIERLRSIITYDYILLDLPYQTNVGDVLIWQAFEDIKPSLGHRCLYQCSEYTYKKPSINRDVVIVFMGGGNFGDLWEHHQTFRHRVMRDFPYNPIVQLQQSVWFQSKEKIEFDIREFANHKGSVSICLRDMQSYNIIKENYPFVNAYILPDLALTLDIKKYCLKHRIKLQEGSGGVLVQRKDKEAINISKFNLPSNLEIRDWPCIENKLPQELFYRKWIRRTEKYIRSENLTRKLTDFIYHHILKDVYIKSGIQFINQYEVVYATRLHVAILSALLGKETYIIDNSYKKVSGVYNLWMQDFKSVKLLN